MVRKAWGTVASLRRERETRMGRDRDAHALRCQRAIQGRDVPPWGAKGTWEEYTGATTREKGYGCRRRVHPTPRPHTVRAGAPHVHAVTRAIGSTLTHVVQQDGKRGGMRHPYWESRRVWEERVGACGQGSATPATESRQTRVSYVCTNVGCACARCSVCVRASLILGALQCDGGWGEERCVLLRRRKKEMMINFSFNTIR